MSLAVSLDDLVQALLLGGILRDGGIVLYSCIRATSRSAMSFTTRKLLMRRTAEV
jgi:hypothetical protein